jgi:signal transduction histidine kinase
LISEVSSDLTPDGELGLNIENEIEPTVEVTADREQLYRVVNNIARNAAEAGAGKLVVSAHINGKGFEIGLRDDGPGLPPRTLANLFKPFDGSARAGRTVLGLAIAGELMRNYGGGLELVETGVDSTCVRAYLPTE